MPLGVRLAVGILAALTLAAAPAHAQEREIEIGPAGASVFESPEPGAPVIREAEPGMRAHALSRQSGYYKVKLGKHGQVGWIRVSDTVPPKTPAPGAPAPGAPAPAPAPGSAAPPPPAASAPSGAPGKPGKLPRPAKPLKGGKAFEVIRAETVADGGLPPAGAATDDEAASQPARKAAPLVPHLRWAWPPPFAEWLESTRAWANAVDGLNLAIAGIIVTVVVLLLLYLVYRVVKWIVLLPVRAARAVGRRVAADVRRRREAPKTERPEVQGRLDEVQGLVAAVRSTGAAEMSLHEVFVAAGGDDVAMSALATAAAAQETGSEFPGWLQLLTGEDPVPLGTFLRAYLLEVVWTRAVSFLDLHPLFGGRGLRTERQEADHESDIAFQFVREDGLGVDLDEEQQRTYFFLTTAIERARVHLPNPYAVADFARGLAKSGESLTEEPEGDEPAPAADAVADGVPPLCVLLFGAAPFQHAGQFAAGPAIPAAVSEALMLHMRAGREMRYGPVHYAARAGVQPAAGVALVGALSGAMSPAAATLKLRQALSAQPRAAATVACAALGTQVEAWLRDPRGRERAAIQAAVEAALGKVHLERAAGQTDGLEALHGRDLEADAHKRLGRWEKVTLAQAILHAHATEVRETRAAVAAAAGRYVEMLARLCERPDEVTLAAVGYLCAGLGTGAYAEAPDAMKVRIAEAARALRKTVPARAASG